MYMFCRSRIQRVTDNMEEKIKIRVKKEVGIIIIKKINMIIIL
jgi:hypothetical protein